MKLFNPSRTRPLRLGALSAAALALAVPVSGNATPTGAQEVDCSQYPWMDTSKSADERADALLDALTLEQTMRWLVEHPATRPADTVFRGVEYPAALPCTPDIQFSDGPHGVQGPDDATAFPAPMAEASAWDESLTYRKYAAVSSEAWENRRTVHLAPGLSAARTPLAARTTEYLGEDPLLSGALAAAAVRALQGANDRPTLSTIKHWVANEQRLDEEESSSNIDERTFREIYNLPFEIAITEGEPGAIMCSYNMINGISACEQPLQTDLLKGELGFDGFIMSDFGGVYSTAPSLNGGMDMELNRPVFFTPANLHAALDAGLITEARIREAAFRVVRSFIDIGLFDVPRPAEVGENISTPEHQALSLEMAQKGSVLLKNDDRTLPLDDDGPTIAVIGSTASLGADVDASTVCGAHGGRVNCPDPVTALEAIGARVAEDGGSVIYNDGSDLASAQAAAAAADLAVVFGYEFTGYNDDRDDLRLDGNGDALVEAVAQAGDVTIVVLQIGTAIEMPWIDQVDAVLNTWYPGDQQGTAIAQILFGDVNPSGKLPLTFPRSVDDTPTGGWDTRVERFPGVVDANGIRQVDYSEGLQVGYRWYENQDIEPLFEFGHGLSYTRFDYRSLQVTPTVQRAPDGRSHHRWTKHRDDRLNTIRIRFLVKNTGKRAGTEIAQAYVELPSHVDEPAKRLVGWTKVDLKPGRSKWVEIELERDELRDRHLLEYWDVDSDQWRTARGRYEIHVGGSSDTELVDRFWLV